MCLYTKPRAKCSQVALRRGVSVVDEGRPLILRGTPGKGGRRGEAAKNKAVIQKKGLEGKWAFVNSRQRP